MNRPRRTDGASDYFSVALRDLCEASRPADSFDWAIDPPPAAIRDVPFHTPEEHSSFATDHEVRHGANRIGHRNDLALAQSAGMQ